jgi:hypothetical protein
MSNEQLADPTQPQRDRLAFVESCVRFIGGGTPPGLRIAVWHPVRRRIQGSGSVQGVGTGQHRLRPQGQALRPGAKLPTRFRLSPKAGAATAGYILRKWSVDCSPDHCLRGWNTGYGSRITSRFTV